ncbi:MAG TPA: 4'-phosphopantetheinyl transferase superfamily protein [Flavobacterium sp.]|nr:4'-phosphopantetheinyl transferase superfamily protein [Flavobacterium sp.]
MIGNDVIDLALARKESNWKREGFLDKIFTAKERAIILEAENPESIVWNLWSRKEAAYKIYNRNTGKRGFFPLEIECTFETRETGSVNCKGLRCFTKTEIDNDSIRTVAVTEEAYFKDILMLKDRVGIEKSNGIPFIGSSGSPVSISHHGRFEQIVAVGNYNPNLDFSFRNNKAIV